MKTVLPHDFGTARPSVKDALTFAAHIVVIVKKFYEGKSLLILQGRFLCVQVP